MKNIKYPYINQFQKNGRLINVPCRIVDELPDSYIIEYQSGKTSTINKKISPNELQKFNIKIKHDGKLRTAFDLLSFNDVTFEKLIKVWPELNNISNISREQIEIESKYKGYLDRQKDDIADFKRDEKLSLPKSIDYSQIGSLSSEVVEKLQKIKPPTLGAAARISGITPSAIVTLLKHVKRHKNSKAA